MAGAGGPGVQAVLEAELANGPDVYGGPIVWVPHKQLRGAVPARGHIV